MSARLTRNSSEAPPNSSHQKCIPFWTAGMALFSMFFGAGNLVFPLVVGASSGDRTHFAVLGLSLSAVLFPLLGLFSMLISGGHLRSFFARFHPVVIVFLLFILHLSQGPVACLPRLVTLMHASCSSIIPAVSLPLFSVLICLLIFLFAIKPYRMVALLGTFLTPLLLLLMAILVFAGIYKGDAAMHVQDGGGFLFL